MRKVPQPLSRALPDPLELHLENRVLRNIRRGNKDFEKWAHRTILNEIYVYGKHDMLCDLITISIMSACD